MPRAVQRAVRHADYEAIVSASIIRVVFFVVYAVLVWYLAARWRRQWRGLLAAIGGVAGVAFVAFLHWRLSEWTDRGIYLEVLQVLLYPYGIVVGAVALFIAALPRSPRSAHCAHCGYDLHGLTAYGPQGLICPECGRRVRGSGVPIPPDASPANEPPQHAEEQRPQGHDADERPPQEREIP